MMGEKEKFIVRISCDPKIEPFGEDFSTKFVDKILTLRVEKVNKSVISQLRDLMKEKGVNELYAIDESKVLEMVKKSQALEIIKKKCSTNCNLALVKDSQNYKVYNEQFDYFLKKWQKHAGAFEIVEEDRLTQEEYDLLKEVLVCH